MESISNKSLNFLRRGFVLSPWIHCHPYIWSKVLKGPQIIDETSGVGLNIWRFNAAMCLSYFSFILYRCIQTNRDPTASSIEKIYMQFITLFHSACALMQTHALFKRDEMARFVRGYLEFMQHVQENHLKGMTKVPLLVKVCEKIIMVLFYSIWINIPFIVMEAIVRPWSPELISSVQPFPHNLSILETVACAVFFGYYMLCFLETALMHLVCAFLLFFSAVDLAGLLGIMINGNRGRYTQTADIFRIYRGLYLLLGEFCRVFIALYAGAHMLLLYVVIFCTYGSIRSSKGLIAVGFAWVGGNSMIVLAVGLTILAQVNDRSHTARKLMMRRPLKLQDLGRSDHVQWFMMEISSFRHLAVRTGNLFFYDRELVLTTCAVIFENIITNLLLLS